MLVTVNAKGDVTTTYEPSTADEDREKEIGMMQSSIEQAGRVVRDIDTPGDLAPPIVV